MRPGSFVNELDVIFAHMKTVVIGASPNPGRVSNRVTLLLLQKGIEVVPLGIKNGTIGASSIVDLRSRPEIENVHTITMYLSAVNQAPWYHYILELDPERIIFNPGAENPELRELADKKGIYTEDACTLVMLSIDNY